MVDIRLLTARKLIKNMEQHALFILFLWRKLPKVHFRSRGNLKVSIVWKLGFSSFRFNVDLFLMSQSFRTVWWTGSLKIEQIKPLQSRINIRRNLRWNSTCYCYDFTCWLHVQWQSSKSFLIWHENMHSLTVKFPAIVSYPKDLKMSQCFEHAWMLTIF